jgi:hypothetical protein
MDQMKSEELESLADALEEVSELLMVANQERYGPLMQVVRIRISGIDYECFTSLVAGPEDETPDVEEIEFGQILPMKTVIQWMTTAQESFTKGRDAGMQ